MIDTIIRMPSLVCGVCVCVRARALCDAYRAIADAARRQNSLFLSLRVFIRGVIHVARVLGGTSDA